MGGQGLNLRQVCEPAQGSGATSYFAENNEIRLQATYAYLMSHAAGLGNEEWLARMLASRRVRSGYLDDRLCLPQDIFTQLLARHFPGAIWRVDEAASPEEDVRAPEREDLLQLFLDHRAGGDPSEPWIAEIITSACMGGDHLWQDLGLWSRGDLNRMIEQNFPALFAKNERNMKWKKFLYRQLCQAEGIYICRSPSCESCIDYADCFGSEE